MLNLLRRKNIKWTNKHTERFLCTKQSNSERTCRCSLSGPRERYIYYAYFV